MPHDPSPGWERFEKGLRVFSVLLVTGVVGLAMTGVTGVSTATATASSRQIRVEVRHASATRPGLSTPFSVTVEPMDGGLFPTTLEIGIPTEFMAMFDENGLHPTPDSEASDGTTRTWTFFLDATTERFTVEYDARLQPNTHRGGDVTVTVDGSFGDGSPLETVRTSFDMTVWP